MSFTLAFMFKLNTSLSRLTSFRMHNSCTITVSWDNRSTRIASYPGTWCHKFKIPWGWTPFYLWILFLMCSSCVPHVNTLWLTSSNQYPPISTSLSIPNLDNHQIHGFKACWMNFTQYKQELLILHTPKNVSSKDTDLGLLLESGREEGSELVCVTHFHKFIQENCLPIPKRGISTVQSL